VGIRAAILVGIGLFAGVLVAVVVVTSAIILDGVLASNGFFGYFRNRISVDVLSAFLVLMAGMAWSYLHSLSMRQREAAALRAQLVESRLESLRVQLNPHLLFNTLNAIAALATVDPAKVQRSIAQLSDLLRYMLAGSHDQEVTVAKEFAILQRYFEILELRYGRFLKTSITGDADAMAAFVPNLLLQPLAENALKHGVSKAGEGSIDVHAARIGDDLVLTVRDSGSGGVAPSTHAEITAGAGFGLRHTRERLEHLYTGNYDFQLRPTPGGTVVEIRIPYHTRPVAKAS
jgi:sensor histidine kinase YesM